MRFGIIMQMTVEERVSWLEDAGRPELDELYRSCIRHEVSMKNWDDVVELVCNGCKGVSEYSNGELRQIIAKTIGVTLT